MDVMTRVPVREQDPQVRAANFEEVKNNGRIKESTCKRTGSKGKSY